jgi:hypothetical protein
VSFIRLARRRSRPLRSASLTGVTTDQWFPTGQRWTLHQPSRSPFTDTPGIHSVVKRWPLLQRTTMLPPIGYPRSFIAVASARIAPRANTIRRRRGVIHEWCPIPAREDPTSHHVPVGVRVRKGSDESPRGCDTHPRVSRPQVQGALFASADRQRGPEAKYSCDTGAWRRTVVVYVLDRAMLPAQSASQRVYFVGRFRDGYHVWQIVR